MAQEIDLDLYSRPFSATKILHRDPYPAISPTNSTNAQKDKIIIITGASSGIGEGAAKVWARAGANGIVIAARRVSELNRVAEEVKAINPSTTVLVVPTDIVEESDVKNLFAQVQKTFRRAADVLFNNAGWSQDDSLVGDTAPDDWWKVLEINLKGVYSMTHHFIRSQPNPKESTATIITNSSGRAGMNVVGGSSYDVSKIGEQRLNEHIQLEYPNLRVFTVMPGIALTAMAKSSPHFVPYAKDHVDLTGMLALYLAQPRADYLKGSMVSVNWDIEELEEHKEEILEKKLFWASWIPILPINGGKGLGA